MITTSCAKVSLKRPANLLLAGFVLTLGIAGCGGGGGGGGPAAPTILVSGTATYS